MRILPAGAPTSRGENIYVNCYPESVDNSLTQVKRAFCVKRKGLKTAFKSYAATGEARGVYYWEAIGRLYSVYGNTVTVSDSAGATLSTITLSTSTGPVGFTETTYGTVRKLFFCDGTKGYLVADDGAVTTVDGTSLSGAIVITNAGSGYESAPTVTFTAVGPGAGAAGTATINNGSVIGIEVTNLGSGYTSAPTITIGVQWVTATAYTTGDYVFNANKVYKATSTGTSGATPPTHSTGTVSDGTVDWEYRGVQATATSELSAFPTPHVPQPQFMDGVLFLAKTNTAQVFNSKIDDLLRWTPTDVIDANQFPGNIVGLARLQNYVMALKTDAVEYLYNNGADTGSILSKTTQAASALGCAQPGTVQVIEDDLFFVGKSAAGGFGVWKVGNFKEEKLSTEHIDYVLNSEYGLYSNTEKDKYYLSGSVIRVDGHKFYVINGVIDSFSGRALVYDIDEKFWSFWDSSASSSTKRYIGIRACTKGGISLVQSLVSSGTGKILYFPTTATTGDYNDAGTVYYSFYNTPVIDMDNRYRKRFNRVEVIGDNYSFSVPVSIGYSDTDLAGLDKLSTYPWTVNMQQGIQSYINNLGSSRGRIWQIATTTDVPFRWENLEVFYEQGVH